MIEGVKVKKLVKFADDRGYFMEVWRDDDLLLERFGQLSASLTYPGVIKAFHYHKKQDDIWFFPVGNAQVVLHDLRDDSPTKGKTDVYYMGENHLISLFIPRGVAHGYRVLGQQPAVITYVTNISYDPKDPDEYRIAHDDKTINFNWNTVFK
ncbi:MULTISPECIES: dTDP-4-dehydrorhamnose 3,5-epimerase family protein [Brevibacillus]|uniref:Spore coat protein n=1 Tax=Brevibacillus laterosporus TaxID=1465 RepID=A0AAP8QDN8_BRELA|nr:MULTISPECIES: dTDP-4-dehydrorhamnose 3,5-epimerase family protein [Brevibacillus]AYB37009.1 spore coat protein [Brevibacillus laterosporus]MBG9788364.1 spore coat protein [Brevibacillus laterosporus]MBM7111608.1 dTDP-4-dehydrorhamnose 3,5-epimerase [Brevibacillus laterosporus]MCG7320087.1 dTDP-4-dehydrorhamnose 3,5-epimerase family protein [Brevibacillus laterosporus]MED1663648.1 dTDP-4-dehydrorhamnose 3,5-epimerase family protein [Brevibacillus laterosporus]